MSNIKFLTSKPGLCALSFVVLGMMANGARAQNSQTTLLPPMTSQSLGAPTACTSSGQLLAMIDSGAPPQNQLPQTSAINCIAGANLNPNGALTATSLATSNNGNITANGSGNISTASGNISTASGGVSALTGFFGTAAGGNNPNTALTIDGVASISGFNSLGLSLVVSNGFATVNGPVIAQGPNGYISATGSVTALKYYHTSDARLKTHIHPVSHALDKLLALQGV